LLARSLLARSLLARSLLARSLLACFGSAQHGMLASACMLGNMPSPSLCPSPGHNRSTT
jgi:hypothetical protein